VDALKHKGIDNKAERERRTLKLLDQVGMDSSDLHKFPHQFSGGQQQRIAIARAIAFDPILLILDEPTASLDVSVQTQITNLLRELQERLGLSYILISHDLSNVRYVAHRIAVMYLGKLVETGITKTIFDQPSHPYTKVLIQSVPIPDPSLERDFVALEGEIPNPTAPPAGCRFHTRCPIAEDQCKQVEPVLKPTAHGTMAACHMIEAVQ
jgi:oligopeptide/dipeptide ABC transporter ATP-binding protein